MSKRILNRSLIAATLVFATAGAQASEPLTTEVLRSVEQVLVSQSKEMLQAAVVDLKLELETELSAQWLALTADDEKAAAKTEQTTALVKE
ncbi:hypothetical protein KJI95_04965 [Shewanella sp. JM162201]|uniref:Uncharacterized protein n=1 Tax=Shewanella jiangmenensis TaxID=2837387 RepID=A0ABS5V1R8_9GAMM|nr:hypothetical protein [Shewanella jiangmenensis]MBT1443873.1 hypothetical protein [Shewanella jiangmenensis]